MATNDIQLPVIDLSEYITPRSPAGRDKVIAQVRDACSKFGFFQLTGHGVTLEQQRGLFRGMDNFFSLAAEEKLKYSFLENPCRRGYEASGMSLRDTDVVADSKEVGFLLTPWLCAMVNVRLVLLHQSGGPRDGIHGLLRSQQLA